MLGMVRRDGGWHAVLGSLWPIWLLARCLTFRRRRWRRFGRIGFKGFFCLLRRHWLCVYGVGPFWFFCLRGACGLYACGGGLSLLSFLFLSLPPVPGAPTFLSLPTTKLSKKKQPLPSSAFTPSPSCRTTVTNPHT